MISKKMIHPTNLIDLQDSQIQKHQDKSQDLSQKMQGELKKKQLIIQKMKNPNKQKFKKK